ncbi:MAG TPA: CoA pyrophosphatase [Nocardioidaceae bacterium]|nr:CoA pyrophosphatase [Nocardioidaceae bacterium]
MNAVNADDLPAWLAPVAQLAEQGDADVFADWPTPDDGSATPASVLILFGHDGGARGPDVLLLERAHDMRSHAGQVAFPGGRRDDTDADDVDTALREAAEETGLDPSGVVVLGALRSIWLPPTNFQVTPVLAWWRVPSAVHAVDPAETAAVVRVSTADLVDPSNRAMVLHPSGHIGPAFLVHDLVVWGFTAGLLARVLSGVGWDRPWDESRVVELPEGVVASSLRDMRRAGYLQ